MHAKATANTQKFGFRETGEIDDNGEAEMMQFLNFEIKPCEEEDAEFFREKIDEISDSIAPPADIIDDGLGEYNHSQVPYEHDFIWLNKKVIDEDGNLIAGIIGGVHGWDSAHVEMMWVDGKQRNRGIGTYLLSNFEREAKENGAYMVILDALDWQMPFFEKHGYTVCGAFEDYPKGHRWCQLQKLL